MTTFRKVQLTVKALTLILLLTIYLRAKKAWDWCEGWVFTLRVCRWTFSDCCQLIRIYRSTDHPDYLRGMAYAIIREGRKRNNQKAVDWGSHVLADLNEPLQETTT